MDQEFLQTAHLPHAQFLNQRTDLQLQNVLIDGKATISSEREIFYFTFGESSWSRWHHSWKDALKKKTSSPNPKMEISQADWPGFLPDMGSSYSVHRGQESSDLHSQSLQLNLFQTRFPHYHPAAHNLETT